MSSLKFTNNGEGYGQVPNGNSVIDAVFSADAYTVDFWVKMHVWGDLGRAAESYFVHYGPAWFSGYDPTFVTYVQRDGRVGWVHQKDGNMNIETAPAAIANASSQWNHLAFVWDGSTRYIYIDGVLAASMAYTGYPPSHSSDFYLGKWPHNTGGHQIWGEMDGVRMWNRALTASEISTYYSSDVVSQTGIQVFWGMDEGSGATTTDSINGISMALTGPHLSWGAQAPGTIGTSPSSSDTEIVTMTLGDGDEVVFQIGKMDIS